MNSYTSNEIFININKCQSGDNYTFDLCIIKIISNLDEMKKNLKNNGNFISINFNT
jgi:hypothetical protein